MIDKLTSIGRLDTEFTVIDGVIGVASATAITKGLMSADDKTKLDNLTTTPCRYRGSSATEPDSPIAGDIWIDTSSGSVVKIYDGTTWTPT